MDVSNPKHGGNDNEEQHDEENDEDHVALALTGEVSLTGGDGIGGARMGSVFFHPPDGRFGGLAPNDAGLL